MAQLGKYMTYWHPNMLYTPYLLQVMPIIVVKIAGTQKVFIEMPRNKFENMTIAFGGFVFEGEDVYSAVDRITLDDIGLYEMTVLSKQLVGFIYDNARLGDRQVYHPVFVIEVDGAGYHSRFKKDIFSTWATPEELAVLDECQALYPLSAEVYHLIRDLDVGAQTKTCTIAAEKTDTGYQVTIYGK